MLRLQTLLLGLGLFCAITVLAAPVRADIMQPQDAWSPPGDHRSPPSHLPKASGGAVRAQRLDSGLSGIASELNDQVPSESGSRRAHRSVYDPSSGRQQIQQSKRIVRRRPGGSQVPAPGALALAGLGAVMVLRLKKSFS